MMDLCLEMMMTNDNTSMILNDEHNNDESKDKGADALGKLLLSRIYL